MQDIGPRYSGVLLGMSNTAGVLAGVFGTAATGFILKNGSWDEVRISLTQRVGGMARDRNRFCRFGGHNGGVSCPQVQVAMTCRLTPWVVQEVWHGIGFTGKHAQEYVACAGVGRGGRPVPHRHRGVGFVLDRRTNFRLISRQRSPQRSNGSVLGPVCGRVGATSVQLR